MLSVSIETRDFLHRTGLPGLRWTVERLEWRALGGPRRALLRVEAPGGLPGRPPALDDLLRCAITIHDDAGAPCWWGYISAVASGGLRRSLDEIANRLRVRYRAPHPLAEAGTPALTGWAEDERSIRLYGVKEGIASTGASSESEALARRDALLSERSLPHVSLVDASGGAAWVEARGWWDALAWTYCEEPRGRLAHVSLGTSQALGDSAARARLAQPIRLADGEGWQAGEAWLRARRIRAEDVLRLELCADSGGLPGSALASAEVPAAGLADELDWVRMALPAAPALAAGTLYWLVVSRSGAPDAGKHYALSVDEGPANPAGSLLVWDGSAWSARLPSASLNHLLWGLEETSEQARRMLAEHPFLAGARVEDGSGVLGRVYRSGERRVQAEVEALLNAGRASGARLLGRIEHGRLARIYALPGPDAARAALAPGGQLTRLDGSALHLSEQPAGAWAVLGALTPPAGPRAVFVERAVWDAKIRAVRIE